MILFILLFLIISPLTLDAEVTVNHPPVPLPGTELRELTSTPTGRDYHIYVGLPGGYADADERYPVLYLLDGQLISFVREDGQLFGQNAGEPGRDELLPHSETHFSFRAMPQEITFNRNSAGVVESATVHSFFGDQIAEKVE